MQELETADDLGCVKAAEEKPGERGKIHSKKEATLDVVPFGGNTYVALCVSNLWQFWMWNMRSPPFRYSITKNRFSWTQTCREVRARSECPQGISERMLGHYLRLEGAVKVCEERVFPG